ncbi:hypothetical protein BTM87_24715 [Salmonella enterica subsp. enterica]|nr:hypothetical protein [Salmonella enterica subsp. enterica]
MANKKFTYSISGTKVTPNINTIDFFDKEYQEPDIAPIDIYNKKKDIHIKLLGEPSESSEWKLLVNLVMLGFVSLVESYCRCIIRRILITDKQARSCSYKNNVSYAAAVYHSKDILPEALLEDASFISEANILETIKTFTGLKLDRQKAASVISALQKYDQICQLRHCIVHRSGLFGTKNAIKLGLEKHHLFLEKPIIIGYEAIQSIASVCDNVVKELNDELFNLLLDGIAEQYDWTGDLRKDKKMFSPYFEIFYSSIANPNKTEELKKCYHAFCQHFGFK